MSSWLWGSSPVDELVDKATSENLPAGSEDLALNLEICDQIRSKQVTPKDAAKALKRRIGHTNPNVQLLALNLTDVCVKNGGHHFLVEIASREFVDNLVSILKSTSGVNYEVKNKILSLIQTWGQLFRGKQGLGYVVDTYMILQHEGFHFPPSANVGAALVESEAPPDWTDSDVCTRCRTAFTLTNRKHHCRACGSTFCGQCSSKTMPLPNIGINQDVRVCDGCFMKRRLGNKSQIALESHGLSGGAVMVPSLASHSKSSNNTTSTSTSTSHANNNSKSSSKPAATTDDDDEDLRRAIEESLKLANTQPGYSAPTSTKRTEPEPTTKTAPAPASQDEEDADLLAAIEASLKEAEAQKAQSAGPRASQRQSSYSSYSSYSFSKKPVAAVSANELTETEKSNIEMFAQLVDRLQMTQGDVTGNRELQSLYEQISKLQMKVALSLEDATKKQQDFIVCNEKIDQAVKMYDHLLQERLNNTYQRRMNSNAYLPSGPGMAPGHGGYGATSPPQTPQAGHVYPRVGQAGAEARYSQYGPSMTPVLSNATPYGQPPQSQPQPQQQGLYTPYQPQAQGYPAQPLQQQPTGPQQQQQQQSYASAPYAVSAPPGVAGVPTAGHDFSQAPPVNGGFPQQQQQQQPLYPPTSGAVDMSGMQGSAAAVGAPMQAMQQPMPGPVVVNDGGQQQGYAVGYAPTYEQQQPTPPQQQMPAQQQQVVYAAAPPQPKVEEAPLIEL
ncbi:Vacuolar protein-sorting-associated protein 27 [Actinomortierella ambigua]|nr:Vacuolar protein-sorting-associated protein 27 [Actinomortierella ambigua]